MAWLKRPRAIARYGERQRSVVGQHGLAARTVTVIRRLVRLRAAGRVPQVVRALAAQRPLDDGVLEPADGASRSSTDSGPCRTTWSTISEGTGASGASGVSGFGLRGIVTPHVMPHTQNS